MSDQTRAQQEVELVFEKSANKYVEDVAVLITKDKVRVPKGKKVGDVEVKQGLNEVPIKIGDRTYRAKLIVEDEHTVRGRTCAVRRHLVLPLDVTRMVVAIIRFRFKPYEKPEIVYGSGNIMYEREWDSGKRVWRTKVYYVGRGLKVDLGWWE